MPAEEKQEEALEPARTGGGCLFGLMRALLVLGLMAGLAAFGWKTWTPQDLTDVASGPAAELGELLEKAQREGAEVVITEAELNGFIAQTLSARQTGLLDVAMRRVVVRLDEGVAEVVIEREVFGYRQTVSMYLRIIQDPQDQSAIQVSLDAGELVEGFAIPVGGRFGELRIPQGFLRLVLGSFTQLTVVYAPELKLLGLDRSSQSGGPLPRIVVSQGHLRVSYPRP